MSPYQSILVEVANNIAILSINRPEKLNALNIKCLQEMSEALRDIEHDEDIRCLIITGTGNKAFAAGADISELHNVTVPKAEEYAELGQRVFGRIEDFRKPVIAAINGFALGGGAELAWACHMSSQAPSRRWLLRMQMRRCWRSPPRLTRTSCR